MDVPVLTAVIGVSGTLLGTIVGGCLTTFTNFLLQKRREKAEFRMACRLIAGELHESEEVIRPSFELKRWWPSELEPGTNAWKEHQHVLASYLSYEAWRDVRSAIRGVQVLSAVSHAYAQEHKTMEHQHIEVVARYVEDIQKGQASLQPYLLGPFRIWPRITRPPISG
jgi:hypothetical protein